MRSFHIPPHIAWPGFVMLILLVGIGGAFSIFYFAAQDGGAQVVEDYYQKASDWDATMRQRAASDALGWQAALDVEAPAANGLRPVVLAVADADGAPVADLRGTLQLRRPQRAAAVTELPLQPTDTPGTYRLLAPIDAAGLWDFVVVAERGAELGAERFETTIRHEVGP